MFHGTSPTLRNTHILVEAYTRISGSYMVNYNDRPITLITARRWEMPEMMLLESHHRLKAKHLLGFDHNLKRQHLTSDCVMWWCFLCDLMSTSHSVCPTYFPDYCMWMWISDAYRDDPQLCWCGAFVDAQIHKLLDRIFLHRENTTFLA